MDKNLTKKIDLYLTEVGKFELLFWCFADLQFFIQCFFSQNGFDPDILKDTSRQVLLVGTVESQAFLHPKATVKDAIDVSVVNMLQIHLVAFLPSM